MGVAALVLGIVSIIVACIPCGGFVAVIPATVGLILGIVDTVQKSKKKEPRGMSIAGIVLTSISLVIIILWVFVLGAAIGGTASFLNTYQNEISTFLNEEDWNSANSWLNEYKTTLENDAEL